MVKYENLQGITPKEYFKEIFKKIVEEIKINESKKKIDKLTNLYHKSLKYKEILVRKQVIL